MNEKHHHDPDPTPAHGTPRPKPCGYLDCGNYAPAPESYCSTHAPILGNFVSGVEFAEAWLSDAADTANPADRLALDFFTSVLDSLHGLVTGVRLGDVALVERYENYGSILLGFVACEGCGEQTERGDTLTALGLCLDCAEEAALD